MPDRTKYKVDGSRPYGKGQLVLEIVRKYLEQHPNARFEEVLNAFPDKLQRSGSQFDNDGQCVIKRLRDIVHERRYHMNADDQLLIMGESVVISREWNTENIQNLISRARELGFEIERVA
ncbi:MAG: hypothetical protein HZB33_02980 [Nitrospirae bacterium]|nr:hypothetical protein [Nitrospirota bacterium]